MNTQFLNSNDTFNRFCKEIQLYVSQMTKAQYDIFMMHCTTGAALYGRNDLIHQKHQSFMSQQNQVLQLNPSEWELVVDKEEIPCEDGAIKTEEVK